MNGRDRPIARLTSGESTTGNAVSVVVTGVAVLAVFVALGLVAETVYDVLPGEFALPGLVVTLAVLGFGGLFVVLRIADRLR